MSLQTKEERVAQKAAYYQANKEQIKENRRARYAASPRSPEPDRRRDLMRFYGITPEVYDFMLKVQGGKCSICTKPPDKMRLAVDHCHETGEVRGLLCTSCNTGIGKLGDDLPGLLRAVEYLEETRKDS